MKVRIDTARHRADLEPRPGPYFVTLTTGCSLGYRRIANSEGTWIARRFDASAPGKYLYKPLGEFAHLPEGGRYDAAVKAATAWFQALPLAGAPGDMGVMQDGVRTVKDACDLYADKCRREVVPGKPDHGKKKAADYERRVEQFVATLPTFAATKLEDLTPRLVERWVDHIMAMPTKSGANVGGKRSAASFNRDAGVVRSALNFALDRGYVTSDRAWRLALRPIKNADGRRDIVLTRAQRVALIKNLPREHRLLIEAMCLLPLRIGALAALNVGDLQGNTLRVGVDKANGDRRIPLPKAVLDLMARMAEGRPKDAPMFPRRDGLRFKKEDWKDEVKLAALEAGLPAGTVATSIRHSVISELVTGRTPLLTVAQIAGTSVRMIEKTYGHLQHDEARDALKMLELPGVARRVKTAAESSRRTKKAPVSAANRIKALLAKRGAAKVLEAAAA